MPLFCDHVDENEIENGDDNCVDDNKDKEDNKDGDNNEKIMLIRRTRMRRWMMMFIMMRTIKKMMRVRNVNDKCKDDGVNDENDDMRMIDER